MALIPPQVLRWVQRLLVALKPNKVTSTVSVMGTEAVGGFKT